MEDIKEKTADEMFEELGYDKYEFDTYIDYLCRINSNCICFRKDTKQFDSHCGIGSEYIDMQELQAINKKCKELRLVRR